MVSLVSFDLEGDFAAFRDPSVTTNQTIYIIPSKSAVIGLLGAMIGISRPNSLGSSDGCSYCEAYFELMRSTSIGIKMRNSPKKIAFFTNHRSLKEEKMKPFKTELLQSPQYTVFVLSKTEFTERLVQSLSSHDFNYTPILGHAYCLARIPAFNPRIEAEEIDPKDCLISSVVLDENIETSNTGSMINWEWNKGVRLAVERHLHHYFSAQKMERRVLRHWIPLPVSGDKAEAALESLSKKPSISKFFKIESSSEVICLY